MAERRMFAKSVIDSDMFLDMSLSTQALYFHLAMRADDDGFINNPKKILRMIGASEDEMKILVAKRYIIPFESGIVVIRHWKIHNYIQSDRYHPSMLPEKASLVVGKDRSYEVMDTNMDTGCIQGCIQERIQDGNIGKVRLGKASLGKVIYTGGTSPDDTSERGVVHTPYQQITQLYHEICKSLPTLRTLSDKRKRAIKARWQEWNRSLDSFKECFMKVEASDFLTGRKADWSADFDWIMKPSNFTKIMEGNYDNKDHKQSSPSQPSNGIVDTDIDWSKYDG